MQSSGKAASVGIRLERIKASESPVVTMGGHSITDSFAFNAPFAAPGVKLTVNGTSVLLSQEEGIVLANELISVLLDG